MVRSVFLGRILLLGALLATFAFGAAAAPRADKAPAEPVISPDQAVAIATGGEVGDNDFRISDMGGDVDYDAFNPDVAYNSTDNEFLVVWEGDDGLLTTDGEFEIFGQRLDAATGAEIGSDFRISHVADDGNPTRAARNPAVAYDSTDNEYLVVWEGDEPVCDAFEIYGRRIEADTGATIGDEFRISDMGPGEAQTEYDAFAPAVAYNSTANRYLVVWHGDDGSGPLVDDEFEIWGQVIRASDGGELGSDFRISTMGGYGDVYYKAFNPAVAFNSANYEYLVVWSGCGTACSLLGIEREIYGQRLDAGDLDPVGDDDFRISHMGPEGVDRFGAYVPAVAYNSTDNEYLVVWEGDDNTPPLVDDDVEIFGRRIYGDLSMGNEIGADHFRISNMGADGDTSYYAYHPDVAYDSTDNEYLVVWEGYHCLNICAIPLLYEIWGQRLDVEGNESGDDFRLSDTGTHVAPYDAYRGFFPAVAYNPTNNEYLAVWHGDDNVPPLVDEEFEIFGQRLAAATGDETGANDFRISNMGPQAVDLQKYTGWDAAVAYNPAENEYLVVWAGDDNTAPLADNEYEVFGQLIDAASGAQVGANDFRISSMGPDGNPGFDTYVPDVAYNSTDNEYLVVWYGDDTLGSSQNGELEIYGQLLDADGDEVGPDDFRISDMGPDLDPDFDAYGPAVAYNSKDNTYLVVWYADDEAGLLGDFEFEIYGQLLDADGNEIDPNDFRISEMGPDGNTVYVAENPDVAYNPTEDEYLVVWHGDDDTSPLVQGEFEIFGQRIEAGTGGQKGDDFRISEMGPNGDASFDAFNPAVAYNSTDNQYLVVWYGDDDTLPLVSGENEIFGQLLDANGDDIGATDFRISDMGPDQDLDFAPYSPAVVYNPVVNEYLVVWQGDDDSGELVDGEDEVFGQRLDAEGNEIGDNDFRLSDMGPDGNVNYDAQRPGVACKSSGEEYLVVWHGDDDTDELVEGEYEVFGQRYQLPTSYAVFLPIVRRE